MLTDKSANFLIPDYQRPYAWEDNECQTLWDDIFSFAFPENNKDLFAPSDEYFLGAIVTYKMTKANRRLLMDNSDLLRFCYYLGLLRQI